MGMQHTDPARQRRRAFIGATSGHLIEWYDYGVYGFLAVYIGKSFFVSDDPTTSLLASFAAFALSFSSGRWAGCSSVRWRTRSAGARP